jgi:hypothetical protein
MHPMVLLGDKGLVELCSFCLENDNLDAIQVHGLH